MEAASVTWRPLGRLLVEQGLLSHLELEAAIVEQEQSGRRLGEILVTRGYITTTALAGALAEQLGIDLPAETAPPRSQRPVLRIVRLDAEPAIVELPPPLPALERHRSRLEQAQLELAERDARIAELEAELARARVGGNPRAHVLLVPGEESYDLVEHTGNPPEQGAEVTLGGTSYVVARLGRSPLPGDPRPCAFLLRC